MVILSQLFKSDGCKTWILPVDVPQPDDPHKVRMSDKLKIPMEFVQNTLIPECKKANCVHIH